MGAKTWMLVYSAANVKETLRGGPKLDREATLRLATALFPTEQLEPIGDGDLSYTCPPKHELLIGCFPNISILAAREFGIDYPSRLPASFISHGISRTIYLHAMHSVVDWFAFAKWGNGELTRSLSVSPDNGVLEDIGERLPFEEPFWSGRHPVGDGYPLPFHPLELGEAALTEFFGQDTRRKCRLRTSRSLNLSHSSSTSAKGHGGSFDEFPVSGQVTANCELEGIFLPSSQFATTQPQWTKAASACRFS